MGIKVKLQGVNAEFKRIDEELVENVNSISRVQAFDTMNKLKLATPVDTGRARNSWILTMDSNEFVNKPFGSAAITVLPRVSKKKFETLYMTNGVPYIENLNSGSSRQAPARFVEITILREGKYNPQGVLFETIDLGGD